MEYTTADAICLQLDGHGDAREGDEAPYAVSTRGIAAALDTAETITGRVDVLSALRDLEEAGVIECQVRPVAGLPGERNVYNLTDVGRARARRLRTDLAEERVEVRNGDRERLPLPEVGDYLSTADGADPMARALARTTDEGTLYVDVDPGRAFVDRDRELDRLSGALSAVRRRGSRTVFVAGEAGAGKTRLVEEVLGRLDESMTVLRGRCARDVADPYQPFRGAFVDLPGGDRLIARIEQEPDDGGDLADPTAIDAGRRALFDDVAASLREYAGQRPLVVFLDNLQWADPSSLDLFGALASTITEWIYPVCFVGAYRPPEDESDLASVVANVERETRTERIELDPLSVADVETLLRRLVGTDALPDAFVAAIHDQTGGNPLFVEESVTHLLESGTVDPDRRRYPDDPDAIAVPDSVEAVVEARIDGLDAVSREVLHLGAVVGERIDHDLLVDASRRPVPELLDHVDVLVSTNVWTADDEGQTYRFTSGVVRDAVLDRASPERTRELHERVAAAMLDRHGDREGSHFGPVAAHYEKAGRERAALEYYERAGNHARDVYAHEDAVKAFASALVLARELDDDAQVRIREQLGRTCVVLGRDEEAVTHFAAMRDLTDDVDRVRRSLRFESVAHANRGDFDAAMDRAERGLSVHDGEDAETCRLLLARAECLRRRGDHAAAVDAGEAALAVARRLDEPELVAEAQGHLADGPGE